MMTLTQYVKAVEADAAYVADCEEQARDMVGAYLEDNARPGVTCPDTIRARAELEVGAELFYRRSARLGIAGLDGADVQPMRIARDPMRAAYDVLRPYVKAAIG